MEQTTIHAPTNGHGPAPVTVNVLSIADTAKRMGVTSQAVRYWVERGHLTPIALPEDPNRQGFDESEIATFERVRDALRASGSMDPTGSGRPSTEREGKADALLFRVLDRLDSMNAKLMGIVEGALVARETNLNDAATRDVVASTLKAETAMKLGLVEKVGGAIDKLGGRLLAPKGGPQGIPFLLSADLPQLKTWIAIGGAAFTKDQQAAILKRIQEMEAGGDTLKSDDGAAATSSTPAWTQVLGDAAAPSSPPAWTQVLGDAAAARPSSTKKKKPKKGSVHAT